MLQYFNDLYLSQGRHIRNKYSSKKDVQQMLSILRSAPFALPIIRTYSKY